jgi:hypothetical protein
MEEDQERGRQMKRSIEHVRGIRWLGVFSLLLVMAGVSASAAEPKPRKIYGHYMGCFVAGTGAIQYHACEGLGVMGCPKSAQDPDPFKRNLAEFAAKSFGGTYRNFGLSPYASKLSLEQAADLEIRRAMRIGLDGFTFDVWSGDDACMKLIDAMFAICESNKFPFELAITLDSSCIKDDMPELRGYTGNKWVRSVKWLLDKHGKSPNLARRDGKPLIMGYQSIWPAYEAKLWPRAKAKLGGEPAPATIKAEVGKLQACEEGWNLIADAYDDMEKAIGQPIYWQFDMFAMFHGAQGVTEETRIRAGRILAKRFPALGSFMWEGEMNKLADTVIEAGAEWSPPMKLQYENFGWYQVASPGTDYMRSDWKSARKRSTLLQFITWNDYHENTNLSPGYNTRYTHYDLTGWFIRWWKTGEQPKPDHDQVYIYSHKYAHGTKMYPFRAQTRTDNVIEVVSILTAPAKLRMPGRDQEWDAPAGYSFHQAPLTPGPVTVELLRDGKVLKRLEHPEPVSDRPFRQDTGKTCWSTEEESNWRKDFGDKTPMFVYSEYGDIDKDGLPNWFEMFWFGKFGDMSTAGCCPDAKADPGRTGKTLLQHYLDQTDPTKGAAPSQPALGKGK